MSGAGWGGDVATAYAETFAPLCAGAHDALLAAAGLDQQAPSGARLRRVLDVGTGTGELAVRAAGTGVEVHGVDPDPEMLAIAARTGAEVVWAEAGLPDLPFPDQAFAAVLACFVVNHLPDPRRGVRELARVTAPGGRVVVTIWPSGATPQARLWAAATEAAGVSVPPGLRLPEHLDFPRTEEGLGDLLSGAGLVEVSARSTTWTHVAAVDSMWRGAEAGIGGIGTVVSALTPPGRQRLRAEYDRLVVDLVHDDRLCFETRALLAVGTRA